MEERVQKAIEDGSRTQAEIDEATEALEVMKTLDSKLQEYMQKKSSDNKDMEQKESSPVPAEDKDIIVDN